MAHYGHFGLGGGGGSSHGLIVTLLVHPDWAGTDSKCAKNKLDKNCSLMHHRLRSLKEEMYLDSGKDSIPCIAQKYTIL